MRCIKDENGKMMFKDAEIKKRWQRYFFRLLNGDVSEDHRSRKRESSDMGLDPRQGEPISKDEIREALKKMPSGKSEGPDQIPLKV